MFILELNKTCCRMFVSIVRTNLILNNKSIISFLYIEAFIERCYLLQVKYPSQQFKCFFCRFNGIC